jgi:hypothetical protein
MSELAGASTWQYAVIAVRKDPPLERLVIAYPDEKTLRTLLAGPSIIALGYETREQALADIDGCMHTASRSECCESVRQGSPTSVLFRRHSQLRQGPRS